MKISLGNALMVMIYGKQPSECGVACCHDAEVLDAALNHAVRWYAVVGTVAIGTVPLLLTVMHLVAARRRESILNCASSLAQPEGVTVPKTMSAIPTTLNYRASFTYLVDGQLSSFPLAPRISTAAQHILEAQRANDEEFARVFANEVVGIYTSTVVRNILRRCAWDCAFHIVTFMCCATLDRIPGVMVPVGGDPPSPPPSSSSPSSSSVSSSSPSSSVSSSSSSSSAVDSVHAMPVPAQWLLRAFAAASAELLALWRLLRRGALLRHAVPGVATPYAFFVFAQSSPRMAERCLPRSVGALRALALRVAAPHLFVEQRWRIAGEADGVWRAMTPKGFAALWCCRSLPGAMRSLCGAQLQWPFVRGSKDSKAVAIGREGATGAEGVPGENGMHAHDNTKHRRGEVSGHIISRWCRSLLTTCLKGRVAVVIFVVTFYAPHVNFTWLPFPCSGGPQYVALCYAEMVSILLPVFRFVKLVVR